jgi:hypothetical protein
LPLSLGLVVVEGENVVTPVHYSRKQGRATPQSQIQPNPNPANRRDRREPKKGIYDIFRNLKDI